MNSTVGMVNVLLINLFAQHEPLALKRPPLNVPQANVLQEYLSVKLISLVLMINLINVPMETAELNLKTVQL